MLECIVNVSEGRNDSVLAHLGSIVEEALLDLHVDPDHHRSVFTLGARAPEVVEHAARALAEGVVATVAIDTHDGVHPRLGALDVVPFVALGKTPTARAQTAARRFGAWFARSHDVPVFLYDQADEPEERSLPSLRKAAFHRRHADFGPDQPHPRLGATAVGAREPLVAINCELTTDDLSGANDIATTVRERNGGLPGVRALGFSLVSKRHAQVSMNLVALDRTGVEEACTRVRDLAEESGSGVDRVELVGLVPQEEANRWSSGFTRWSGLDPSCSVEARLAQRRSAPPEGSRPS